VSRLVGVKAKGDGPLDLWPGRTRAWLALRIRIAPSVGAPGRGARLHVGRPGRLDGRPSKFVREPEFAAVFQQTASHRASHTPAPAGRARGPVRPTGGQHRCHKCGFRRCIGRAGARGDGAMARAQLGMQQGLPASLDRQKHPPAVGSPAHSDARFDGCPLSARPAPTPKFPATLGDNMLAGSYTERLGERGPRRALALDKCNVPSSRGPAAFARKDRVRAAPPLADFRMSAWCRSGLWDNGGRCGASGVGQRVCPIAALRLDDNGIGDSGPEGPGGSLAVSSDPTCLRLSSCEITATSGGRG